MRVRRSRAGRSSDASSALAGLAVDAVTIVSLANKCLFTPPTQVISPIVTVVTSQHVDGERPPPLQVDARRVVLVGIAVWFVLVVLGLCFISWLDHHGHRVWLWTSVDGLVLGLLGMLLMVKHRREGRVR